MFAGTIRRTRHRRRGVVLVLILAMLGLLALIGVTFATFSGQAQVGARNYAERMNQPDPDKVFDFALAQLIYDTDNPASALHGHSLVRDMYGNDSHNHGLLSFLPGSGLPLTITNVVDNTTNLVITTNIPTTGHPSLYGATFRRWTMRLNPDAASGVYYPAQTFEVLADTVVNGYHVFTVPPADTSVTMQQPISQTSNSTTFTLDGRYQRAFNGPGLSPIHYQYPNTTGGYIYSAAMFGNFMFGQAVVDQLKILYGGNPTRFSPDTVGMDEDYDAVDTENWFLAAQNGDSSINIPSFHRPALLTANDWVNSSSDTVIDRAIKRAKILRPRAADHPAAGQATFPDLVPDSTGKINYDVDNDGDGVTDAVWLDLGFPPQRDTSGKLYKPLFAITVVGLNGRLPLNTVGNISGRTRANSGVSTVINDTGKPTLDHVSHLGYTPSEINPKYAFSGSDASNGLTQLQKLLQGTVSGGNPIDGRWGESEQLVLASASDGSIPFPRPGRSANLGASDDNLDALDFMPHPSVGYAETGNLTDAAGGLLLPSERMRYGVVPIDTTGNGFLVDWTNVPSLLNVNPLTPPFNYGAGFDKWGRVGYFMYYRPPGRPYLYTNTLHSWESHRYPVDSNNPDVNGDPLDPNSNKSTRARWGAMPFNNGGGTGAADGRAGYALPLPAQPTFVGDINAQVSPQATNPVGVIDATNTYGLLPGAVVGTGLTAYSSQNGAGTLGRDDPTEVNLYQPNQLDELFSYPDLEWLYRLQDIDGSSLQSRLSSLLPEAFAGTSNLPRRKQFSLEAWDTNDFAWANDNPANSFPYNATFLPNVNASYRTIGFMNSTPSPTPPLAARGRKINLNMPLPISTAPREPTRIKWINDAYTTFKAVLPPKSTDTPEELAAIGQYCVNIIDFRDPDDTITMWTNPDVMQSQATATTYSRLFFRNPPTGMPAAPAGSVALVQYGMEYLPVAINEAVAFQYQRIETPNTTTTAKPVPSRRLMFELINLNTEDRGKANNGVAADLGLDGWEIVVLPDTGALYRPDPISGQIPPSAALNPPNLPTLLKHSSTAGTPFQRAYLGWDTTGKTHQAVGPSDPAQPRKLIPALDESGARSSSYYVLGYPPVNPDDETHEPTPDSVLEGKADDLLPDVKATYNQYIWIYLRRPLNVNAAPDDNPTSPTYNPSVVVDSIRIPMAEAGGTTGTPIYNTMTSLYQVTTGTQALYSTERLQPYRGGQAVPHQLAGTTAITNAMVPRYAYGYSEQTKPCDDRKFDSDASKDKSWKGQFNKYVDGTTANTANNPMTTEIRHTLGAQNDSNVGSGVAIDVNWSPLIFHDRDFAGVAELLLVPGCAPGLFTKQFVERGGTIYPADPASPAGTFPHAVPPTTRPKNDTSLTSGPYDYQTPTVPSRGQYVGLPLNPALNPGFTPMPPMVDQPVYPYLPDNFYYTGASTFYPGINPLPDATDMNGTNTATGDPTRDIGGPNGAGWYRALEFFEVPSPMLGAIGSVADGENRDWMRQDLRPGQLNLNLIYDEAVYLGLMDEPRLNTALSPGADDWASNPGFNFQPRVVTQVNASGYPTAWTSMSVASGSFSDFLKLRHGGSGFLFAFGGGSSGYGAAIHNPPDFDGTAPDDPSVQSQAVAAERPFRSLSYPSIDYTILRPATIEPTPLASTPAVPAPGAVTTMSPQAKTSPTLAQLKDDARLFTYTDGSFYWGDPGLKNPFLSRYLQDGDTTRSQFARTAAEITARPTSVVQPPPIPPRRLFELADYVNQVPAVGPPIFLLETSNASVFGDTRVNNPSASQSLSNIPMDLFAPDGAAVVPPIVPNSIKLGITPQDLRRHPLYRTELLHKLMNLTTVRTHQYAVWVTVGFFEVVQPGNPQLANVNPAAAIDQLGPEVGLAGGTNVRHRSFFIIDRTRATGFDPSDPGDFRSLILHRRRIE